MLRFGGFDGYDRGTIPAQEGLTKGSFAPVLFVPGFAQRASSWDEVRSWFDGVAPTAVLDLATLAGEAPTYGFDTVIDALVEEAAVLKAVAGVAPVIAAYSMGGRIILEAIARGCLAPQDVSGLVIESAAAGPADAAERAAFATRNAAWATQVRELGSEAFMEEWAQLPLFATQRELPEGHRAQLAAGRSGFSEKQLVRQLDALGQHNQSSYAETVQALREFLDVEATQSNMAPGDCEATERHPQLIYVAGEQDVKYSELGGRLIDDLKCERAELCVVPEAGHNTHFEDPIRYGRILFATAEI